MTLPSSSTLIPAARITHTPRTDEMSCNCTDSELLKNEGRGTAKMSISSGIHSRRKITGPVNASTSP